MIITRSIGDDQAKKIGVTYEPDIFEHKITAEDRALIIGSDGLWSKMSNEEVAEILNTIYKQRWHFPNMVYGFDWMTPKDMASRLTNIALSWT